MIRFYCVPVAWCDGYAYLLVTQIVCVCVYKFVCVGGKQMCGMQPKLTLVTNIQNLRTCHKGFPQRIHLMLVPETLVFLFYAFFFSSFISVCWKSVFIQQMLLKLQQQQQQHEHQQQQQQQVKG